MKREFLLPGPNGYDISCMTWSGGRERSVLICMHGFTGDKYSTVIRRLAETMAEKDVATIAFDWPGHGASPVDGSSLTVENCLADLDAVVQTVRGRGLPLYLFATSFGGFLSVNYLNRHPDVFSRIVLRSPALEMPDLVPLLLPEEQRRIMEDGGIVDFGRDRPLLLGKAFCENLRRHRIAPDAYPAGLPGLVIQGGQDNVVDPVYNAAFAERNGLALHLVPGADHFWKRPGDLEEIVSTAEAFLLKGEA